MKFTEARLEEVFIRLLQDEGYPYYPGQSLTRLPEEVILEEDLLEYLLNSYQDAGLTLNEARSIILKLQTLPASDLYESNKKAMLWLADGFNFKREDRNQKDIWIYLIDYSTENNNTYKFFNQLESV